MNLEQAGHFIRHPQELQLSHAEALKNLASRHPYSSVYALLYLTALANGKSPELDDALAANAYRLSDRTRLYHLLAGDENIEKAQEVQSDQNDLKTEVNPEVSADTNVEPATDFPSLQLTGIETDKRVETGSREDQNDQLVEQTNFQEEPERKSEAEIGFDFEKITTAHSLEQAFEVEPPSKEDQKVESAEEAEYTADQSPQVTEIESVEEDQVMQKEVVTDERKSFTSWLRSANIVAPKVAEPISPVIPKSKANDLIEKFIKEEPSITRSKTEFFSPSKKAKESLSEDTAPVSETLARIYAAQGNYPKAIHVYHQLMLSVPEKKSLFAVRIEELKKKITQ